MNNETSHKGAMAALLALREAETIAGNRMNDYFLNQDLSTHAITSAAEPLSPFMQGFVAAFAEYVYFINAVGTPDLHVWKPEATMDEADIKARRIKMIEDVS